MFLGYFLLNLIVPHIASRPLIAIYYKQEKGNTHGRSELETIRK